MHRVRLAGLEKEIEADSAGTSDWNVGRPPHPGTAGILRKQGIEYTHSARQLANSDFSRFHYIVTMDESNYEDVVIWQGKAQRHYTAPDGTNGTNGTNARFLDFAPHLGVREVPDPYYTNRFQEVYSLIEAAAQGLLDTICREHGLKPANAERAGDLSGEKGTATS